MAATLFDGEILPGHFNLGIGCPDRITLSKSCQILRESSDNRLKQDDACNLMSYGPEFGDHIFLSQLQSFLTDQYNHTVDKEDLTQTCGSTHGLHLLCTFLFSEGDLIFVECFSYFLALEMFRTGLGMSLVSVDIDANGIDPIALEEAIKSKIHLREKWKPTQHRPYWAMLYLIPQYHNPTGVCLTPERSRKIVEIARKYDLLVVCDDVYNMLYFPQYYSNDTVPLRLFAYDKKTDPDYKGNVVSVGTFSKIFAPGVRCGWIESPQLVKERFIDSALFRSGGATNHAMCGLLFDVMKSGKLTQNVREVRLMYQERCKAMMNVFHARLPSIEIIEPKGGYFIWLKLPDSIDVKDFVERLSNDKKVKVRTGDAFSADPTCSVGKQCLRISFAFYECDELSKAANLIADVILELT